jgi:DNA helicase-2/ATP-dependent DNA helicase PcrA
MNLALEILHASGYQNFLESQGLEGQARLDNVKELIQAMEPFHSLEEFLEHVGLLLEIRSKPGEDSVTLMTLHSAKGLEFDEVFLPGWEEQLFPHSRCLEDSGSKGLEEERRLAYVGITRARHKSTISFCWNRKTYHGTMSSSPSRFIQEIPAKDTIIHLSLDKKVKKEHAGVAKASSGSSVAVMSTSENGFQPGQRVSHSIFGLATVIHQNGDQVKVRFDQSGEKILISRFLKNALIFLTVLEFWV